MIRLYKILLDCENIKDIKALYPLLPERLKSRVDAKPEKSRDNTLCCYYLLNNALKGTNYTLSDLYYSDNGKPLIDGVFVSFSHKDNLSVLVLSDTPCGVDAESITDKEYKALARFSEKEQQLAKNSPYGFCELWTKKEAVAKISGEGIRALNGADIFDKSIFFKSEEYKGFLITVAAKKK